MKTRKTRMRALLAAALLTCLLFCLLGQGAAAASADARPEKGLFSDKGRKDTEEDTEEDGDAAPDAQTVILALQGLAALSPGSAAEIAGQLGAAITDTDEQLAYCALLQENGYDLTEVYPDGVEVDLDLSEFQFYLIDTEREDELDFSRALIFSRDEEKPVLEEYTSDNEEYGEALTDDLTDARMREDYPYTVRLQPGLMQDLGTGYAAASVEECTAVVLLEKGWINSGAVMIRTGGVESGMTYRFFPHYAAYETICVYSTEDPAVGSMYDGYYSASPGENGVVGSEYSDAGIDLSGLELAEIQSALKDPDSEESREILEKYDDRIIEFVRQTGWGDYILIPDRNEDGAADNLKGTSGNISVWFTEKYMIGVHEDGWMEYQLNDGAIPVMALYFLLFG